MHNPDFSHVVSTELPSQLFPAFNPAEMKEVDATSLLPPVVAAAAASSSAGPDIKAASASSFKAAMSSFPLASLRLPAPTLPLLSRGVGRSSSHLSLIALDPESSVLQPGVLQRLKLSMIKGEARGVGGKEERDADAALPPAAPGLRKRGSSKLASANEIGEETHKKQKKLPLVPKQSLLTLDAQLSRDQSSAANTELAAFALARHLVDWAEGFNIESDEDDDDEEEEQQEAVATRASPVAIGSLPRMPEVDSVPPPAEWMARSESLGHAHVFTYSTPDCISAASTPAFEPPLSRSGSSASLATITPADNVHEVDSSAHAAVGATTEGQLHDLCMLEQMVDGGLDAQAEHDAGAFLFPSATFSPLASSHGHMHQPMLLPQLSLGLSSALPSPKVSPALLAHLSSPEERAAMLSFQLDDHSNSAHPPDGGESSPLLAHTTTSTGARVTLIQHMHSHQQPQQQLSW